MSWTRRQVLAMPALLAVSPSTGARIREIRIGFEDYRYRAPYKFGGKEVDRVTLLNVHPSRVHDLLAPDELLVEPATQTESYIDSFGNRCMRLVAFSFTASRNSVCRRRLSIARSRCSRRWASRS